MVRGDRDATVEQPGTLREKLVELACTSTGLDPFRRVDAIRQYAYESHVWSNDGLNLGAYCQNDLDELPVQQIDALFGAREIGVLCGGVATFLAKLYRLLDYDASTYNYGISAELTHVTTVVIVPIEGRQELIIEDATFNLTYRVQNGPRDLREVFAAIMKGRFEEVCLEKGVQKARSAYFSESKGVASQAFEYYRNNGVIRGEKHFGTSHLAKMPYYCVDVDLDFHTSYLRRRRDQILATLGQRLSRARQINEFQMMLFPLNLPQLRTKQGQDIVAALTQDLADWSRESCVP